MERLIFERSWFRKLLLQWGHCMCRKSWCRSSSDNCCSKKLQVCLCAQPKLLLPARQCRQISAAGPSLLPSPCLDWWFPACLCSRTSPVVCICCAAVWRESSGLQKCLVFGKERVLVKFLSCVYLGFKTSFGVPPFILVFLIKLISTWKVVYQESFWNREEATQKWFTG